MGSGGLSGTGVGMATAGAFLIYIGMRNIPVLQGLRSLSGGKLPQAPTPASAGGLAAAGGLLQELQGSLTASPGGSMTGPTGGPWPQLVTAAQQYSADHYSQTLRWAPGFSDCSSFVGKALQSLGVTPPGISVTTSYLAWGQLMRIDRSQVGAGDLICNTAHIIIATSNSDGIGQENSRLNVQTGTIENLMGGQSFVCLRYTGARPGHPITGATAAGLAA